MSAPFRIERPYGVRATRSPAPGQEFKEYLGRLLKMIPGEVIGLYLIGSGFIPADQKLALAGWAVFCLVMVFVVRIYGTADPSEGKPPQPVPVVIAAVAFVIWIYSLGGPFAAYGLHVPYLGSLAVLAWSFVIPIFYKGSEPESPG